MTRQRSVDLCIVGAGISGSALFYLAAAHSDLGRVALIDKSGAVGAANSSAGHNSQTLHIGDIETNYTAEQSRRVKEAAELLEAYLQSRPDRDLCRRLPKMVLAVGCAEIDLLRRRFADFCALYPELEWLDRRALAEREPALTEGRPATEPVAAMVNRHGLAVDFGAVARSLFDDAVAAAPDRLDVDLDDGADEIEPTGDGYRVHLESGDIIDARAIAVDAGGDSLRFARQLGRADSWGLINVGGDFFETRKIRLGSKVYTVQDPELPFASIHADPDVHDPAITRLGPSAVVTPLMERGEIASFGRFARAANLGARWLRAAFGILLSSPAVLRFNAVNLAYAAPGLGRHLFARRARHIIPSLEVPDLEPDRLRGGVRPQVIDLERGEIDFGEKKISGDGAILVITPSPGASVSLASALDDARQLVPIAGGRLDEDALYRDIGLGVPSAGGAQAAGDRG